MTSPAESSFRDPHGRVFYQDGTIYRAVNSNYKAEYEHLMSSGLYNELTEKGLMVSHVEVANATLALDTNSHYKTIQPKKVTITYAPEWPFSALKDAALLTLRVQHIALKYNMCLKDASVYNVQFHAGKPIFIDTLSFEFYEAGKPWIAYRQFCEHFFGPLLLIASVDPIYSSMYTSFLDGFPLQFVNKTLPLKKKFSLGVLLHIVLHSRSKRTVKANENTLRKRNSFTIKYLKALTKDLHDRVSNVNFRSITDWSQYYDRNVTAEYLSFKIQQVAQLLSNHNIKSILDLGANDGTISRKIAEAGIEVFSTDYDHASVERNYNVVKKEQITNVFPLVLDVTNPTPSFGWANTERNNFFGRIKVEGVVALALVHHLALFFNLPFYKIASLFSTLGEWLLIEFVPKSDPMVKVLLQAKEDVYPDYTAEAFETEFLKHYSLVEKILLPPTERVIYLFKK